MGGSTRDELLKFANKDNVGTKQWRYLSVKLEDCNPNKTELEEIQRLKTQPESIDPSNF